MDVNDIALKVSGGRIRLAVQARIIEAAGEVFAEKGFEKSTSREICERAGVNAAAVNYHFGGVDSLYAQVVAEAHRRATLPDAHVLRALTDAPAEKRLLAVICDIARRLAHPPARSWEIRVLSREFISPSSSTTLIDTVVEPHRRAMKALIAQALACAPDDRRVGHILLFVISPCIVLAIANASAARSMVPGFAEEEAGEIESLVAHFGQFVSAGLRACGAETPMPAKKRGKP